MAKDQRELLTPEAVSRRLCQNLLPKIRLYIGILVGYSFVFLLFFFLLSMAVGATVAVLILSPVLLSLVLVVCFILWSVVKYRRIKALKFLLVEDRLVDFANDERPFFRFLHKFRLHRMDRCFYFAQYGYAEPTHDVISYTSPGDTFILAVLPWKYPIILGYFHTNFYRIEPSSAWGQNQGDLSRFVS